VDLQFINYTETPINYHEIVNSSHYAEAMNSAGQIMKYLSKMLHEYFPDTEIIVSVGNNDVVPDYYLELKEEDTPLGNLSISVDDAGMLGVLFDALSNKNTASNKAILTHDDEWTFLRGGYYSRMFHDGNLVLLSLNTVLYANNFEPESIHADDPGKQFLWMKKMMEYSRQRKCQVIIIGHIPPTLGSYRHNQFWRKEYVQTYYNLIEEYDDVVIAQLFGHLHSDEFRIGDISLAHMNTESKIDMIPSLSSPLLLGPSVTPIHGNHPSFRLVTYECVKRDTIYSKGTFKLLDYDSYNSLIDTKDGNWTKLYTFSDVYSSTYIREEGLSGKTMRSIVESMENTIHGRESPSLMSYRAFIKSGAVGESQYAGSGIDCDEKCVEDWICTIISATKDGYDKCLISRRESKEKANHIMAVTLAIAVGIVIMLVFLVRRQKSYKRSQYEESSSVQGQSGSWRIE
jgi:sphingomyelin phosphodiesterase acid-like 3